MGLGGRSSRSPRWSRAQRPRSASRARWAAQLPRRRCANVRRHAPWRSCRQGRARDGDPAAALADPALHAEQCRAGTDADAAARPRARHGDRNGAGNAPLLLGGIPVAQRRGDRAWRGAAWIPGLDPPRHRALRRRHPGRLGGAPPAEGLAPPAIRLRGLSRQQQAVDDVAEDREHRLRIRAIEDGGVLGAEHRPPRNRASGVAGEVDRDHAPSCAQVAYRDDLLLGHGFGLRASSAPARWPGNWPDRPTRWPARLARPYKGVRDASERRVEIARGWRRTNRGPVPSLDRQPEIWPSAETLAHSL